MVRLTFTVGGGKLVRTRYDDSMPRWCSQALKSIDFTVGAWVVGGWVDVGCSYACVCLGLGGSIFFFGIDPSARRPTRNTATTTTTGGQERVQRPLERRLLQVPPRHGWVLLGVGHVGARPCPCWLPCGAMSWRRSRLTLTRHRGWAFTQSRQCRRRRRRRRLRSL